MKNLLIVIFVVSFLWFCDVKCFSYFELGSGFMFLTKKMSQIMVDDADDCKIESKWVKQPLNHFNKSINESWSMRYFENLRFWEPGAPLYFFVGGMGEADPKFLTTGLMYDLAKETKGAMFLTEHRYYGESIPSDDFKYLDSRQALADVARLIRFKKAEENYKASKVVVIGGSDAGNLAVWLRAIFPKKVDAVIASSAPLLARADFDQFLPQVAINYKKIAPLECWKKIKEKLRTFDDKFKYNYGIHQLEEEEKICQNVDMRTPENQQFFIQSQLSIFMACTLGGRTNILESCDAFNNISKVRALKLMFAEENYFWNDEQKCFDYDFLKYINKIKEKPFIKAWVYQQCTEFGHFPTTTSDQHPFPKKVPTELYYLMCSALFGSAFTATKIHKGIKYTNFIFGGKEPNVTRVIFVNGELDPMRHLGIVENLSPSAPAIVIPNASHCKDLFYTDDDSVDLINARLEIKNIIQRWLNSSDPATC